jgi:hypothetical protein|tara:strand:- start:568 stop:774 length:207 start_codon:yes stop_codon:yes gene_type:complete
MTKKIRLMEEESTTDTVEETVDTSTSTTLPESSDMVVRQLMKYLEAIDWKLWEILKIQKKLIDEKEEE